MKLYFFTNITISLFLLVEESILYYYKTAEIAGRIND